MFFSFHKVNCRICEFFNLDFQKLKLFKVSRHIHYISFEVRMLCGKVRRFLSGDLEDFEIFLKIFRKSLVFSGFDVISEKNYGKITTKLRLNAILVLSLMGLVGCIKSTVKNFLTIEKLVLSVISAISMIQFLSKMIEMMSHRSVHHELIAIVKTARYRENNEIFKPVFNRMKFYLIVTFAIYSMGVFSLQMYPWITYAFSRELQLGVDMEIPFTSQETTFDWTLNYILGIIISTYGCTFIIGKFCSILNL